MSRRASITTDTCKPELVLLLLFLDLEASHDSHNALFFKRVEVGTSLDIETEVTQSFDVLEYIVLHCVSLWCERSVDPLRAAR